MALREDLRAEQVKNEAYVSAVDDAIELLESLGDDEELDETLVRALTRLRAVVE